ncbi:nuclease HARBI1 [Spatholobus suberectus]|nr:nuclease HARBI1 [Spatholobus suberectus]
MDQSFLVMLSNLLHLHNSLDPTSSVLSDALSSSATPSSLLYSSSIAPLLFFTIASVLSYVASTRPTPSRTNNANSDYSVSAFRALSTEHICEPKTNRLDRTSHSDVVETLQTVTKLFETIVDVREKVRD